MICFLSEPRQKMRSFKLKIPSPTKRPSKTMVKGESRRTLIESGGDVTSKSTVGTTMKNFRDKSGEPRLKSSPLVEWALIYTEEEGDLLLILAKSEGEGKLQVGKKFIYGYVRNIEYEDNDS